MAKVRSWVGLDVHARSVLAVTIDGESGELRSRQQLADARNRARGSTGGIQCALLGGRPRDRGSSDHDDACGEDPDE